MTTSNKRLFGFLTVLAVFFVLLAASESHAATTLVNMDYGKGDNGFGTSGNGGTSTLYVGAGVIGSGTDIWNSTDTEMDDFSETVNLKDSTGGSTGITLIWNEFAQSSLNPNAIEFGSTGHNALMEDYSFTAPGTTSTFTFSNLNPGEKYKLHLLGVPDGQGQNTTFTVTGANQGARTVTAGNVNDDNGLDTADDYVTFTGTVDGTGTLVYTQTSDIGFSGSNGFQLDLNPEPTTQLINMDFGKGDNGVGWVANGGTSELYVGAGVVGSAGDYWNATDTEMNDFTETVNLKDASGVGTGVSLTWDDFSQSSLNPNAIEFGSTGHNPLMEDYAFTAGGTTATYTLSGLQAGDDFMLYLYGVPDGGSQDTLFDVIGANEAAQHVVMGNVADDNGLATPDDYVVFTGTIGAGGTIVWTQTTFSNQQGGFSGSNGFQLLTTPAVPEPESIALSVIGLVGLIGFGIHRRRRAK